MAKHNKDQEIAELKRKLEIAEAKIEMLLNMQQRPNVIVPYYPPIQIQPVYPRYPNYPDYPVWYGGSGDNRMLCINTNEKETTQYNKAA